MDWFSSWPKDALIAVANHFLAKFPIVCTTEVKNEVIDMTGSVQDEVSQACIDYFDRFRRPTYVTPKSFLSFLDGYKKIYSQKLEAIQVMAKRMNTGLAKLVEAGHSVEELKKDLEIKEKDIAVANEAAEAVSKKIQKKKCFKILFLDLG